MRLTSFWRPALVLASAALLGHAPAAARAPQTAATLRGAVLDAATMQPVPDAEVQLVGASLSAVTDALGRFVFEGVLAGAYLLEVRHVAYESRSERLLVRAGEDLGLEVTLARTAVELEPLRVVARARKLVAVGFYDRQARGLGTYFTREEIERQGVQRLSDLLSRVPGLRRTISSDGRSSISMRGVKSIVTNCDTQYFIDGVRAEIGGVGVDVIPPRDIEGIEIYRGSSELPIQFDVGRAMCGAVLIWTRGN